MKRNTTFFLTLSLVLFISHSCFSQINPKVSTFYHLNPPDDSSDLSQFFNGNTVQNMADSANTIVIIDDDELLALSIDPNPFSDMTEINMSVNQTMDVTLQLFDSMGNSVIILFSGELTEGVHTLSYDGSKLDPGVYYLVFMAPHKSVTNIIVRQ